MCKRWWEERFFLVVGEVHVVNLCAYNIPSTRYSGLRWTIYLSDLGILDITLAGFQTQARNKADATWVHWQKWLAWLYLKRRLIKNGEISGPQYRKRILVCPAYNRWRCRSTFCLVVYCSRWLNEQIGAHEVQLLRSHRRCWWLSKRASLASSSDNEHIRLSNFEQVHGSRPTRPTSI